MLSCYESLLTINGLVQLVSYPGKNSHMEQTGMMLVGNFEINP